MEHSPTAAAHGAGPKPCFIPPDQWGDRGEGGSLMVVEGLIQMFADEARWTRGALARTSAGLPTQPESADAVCYCLGAGLDVLTEDLDPEIRTGAEEALLRTAREDLGRPGLMSLEQFNDDGATTYAELMQLLGGTRNRLQAFASSVSASGPMYSASSARNV